jgi:hypothetical protein
MYDTIRRNLRKSGYCKTTICLSKEDIEEGTSVCRTYIDSDQHKVIQSLSGTTMCDWEIPNNYVSCMYENEKGIDPLKRKVQKFMSELLDVIEPKLCQIYILYQEGSGDYNCKQRWHTDFSEEDVRKNSPFIAYVPLTTFDIGVIPNKIGLPNLSSQRKLSMSQGEILILQGGTAHRELSRTGSLCLLYYFEMNRKNIMHSVIFKTWTCIKCDERFSSENGMKYHEKNVS